MRSPSSATIGNSATVLPVSDDPYIVTMRNRLADSVITRYYFVMRVIGGEFRSRRLKSIPGDHVRPTPDRLRESLFNILAPRIEDAVFLDAYAGTGAVGIEALSRGAARAIFIEKNKAAAELIQENLKVLGLTSRAQVLKGSAQLMLPRYHADLIFVDPPYHLASEYDLSLSILGQVNDDALIIVQHASHHTLVDDYGTLKRTRIAKQGSNCLSFYKRETEKPGCASVDAAPSSDNTPQP